MENQISGLYEMFANFRLAITTSINPTRTDQYPQHNPNQNGPALRQEIVTSTHHGHHTESGTATTDPQYGARPKNGYVTNHTYVPYANIRQSQPDEQRTEQPLNTTTINQTQGTISYQHPSIPTTNKIY